MIAKRAAPDGRLAKLLRLGLGAFWMTEKSVRSAVQGLPLTKDAANFLLEQIERRKSELVDVVRSEIQHLIAGLDVHALARELLKDYEIDVQAKIRLIPRKNR
ncbi:MAG: hypothetical protein HY543_07060 [Deltaproteobacteria bacterium]|nr:hypothetical protein [Deltaproteobacteria bacterium]